MMRGARIVLSMGLLVSSVALASAQPTRSDVYDMTTSTTLKGTVSAVVMPTGAPVYLIVSVPTQSGVAEDWAIQGDPANTLIAAGWRPRMGVPVAAGNVVEVVVHRVKAGVDPVTLVPAVETALVTIAKARRLAYGTEIRLDGGKVVIFGGNKP